MANKQVLHKRSSVINTDGSPKLPDATKIDYGELAINYADTAEVLSIKNSNNAIIPFIPKRAFIEAPIVDSVDYLIGVKDNELIRISPSDIGVVTYTYSTPEITLTYGTADNTASTVSPTLSYTQVKTGSDGTTETITGSLENPNGATITFSISSSESDVSIDSSTGVVSFKANSSDSARTLGTVNVTVVWNEENGSGTATVTQAARTVVSTKYGTPSVSLSYATASAAAGTVSPTSSYTQSQTITYSDGTTSTSTLSSGGTYSYSISGAASGVSINSSTGVVTYGANSSSSQITLGTVTLKVTANSESGSRTATVYQEGATVATGEAGDICFYDSNTNSKVIVAYDTWNASQSSYPSSRYTPIGVVAVPSSHNVYGDNTLGVVSLKDMSYSTPDSGTTSSETMYWGQYGVDTSLTNWTGAVYCGSTSSQTTSASGVMGSGAYMPSDQFTGTACVTDTEAFYNGNYSYAVPSPYLSDGSRNSVYYQNTSPASGNMMSDLSGASNTSTLLNLATAQSDWKTARTITNNSGSGYSPAACCCWRYNTSGTSQGDWYLPAMGEIGYMIVRQKRINTTIASLISTYDSSVGVQLGSSYAYWSSCENSSGYACNAYTGGGSVYVGNLKNNDSHVRAFLRV